MAKVSFSKSVTNASQASEVAVQTSTAVPVDAGPNVAIAQPPVPVPAPASPTPGGFFDDDSLEPGDLVLPRLAIAQRVGDLGAEFSPGTVVLAGSVELAGPPEKDEPSKEAVRLVVLGFQPTLFVERVQGGGRGNIVRTEAEVRVAGGTLDYTESQVKKIPLYQRLATALVAVKQPRPELAPEQFPFELEGAGNGRWALALWSMRGTSYTHAARHIKSARKLGHLRQGYRYGYWDLRVRLRKFEAGALAYVPVITPAGPTSEEFRKNVAEILGF